MSPETKAALDGSIVKWERIVAGTHEDEGIQDCPLCQLFRPREENCTGCPVLEYSGQVWCCNTPYYRTNTAEGKKAMLDFLKELKEHLNEPS